MSGTLDNGLPFIVHDGRRRVLACLPPPRPNLAAMPGLTSVVPVRPREEWFDCSLAHLGIRLRDQGSQSSCVGQSGASALEKSWRRGGGEPTPLSAAFLYSLINGGRDAGASIGDAITAMIATGVAPESDCPESCILSPLVPAAAYESAKRFRALDGYHCRSFDEVCTAVQFWGVAVFALCVDESFANLDAEGCPPVTRGPGNHAIHADGLVRLPSGRWALRMVNSWGTTFGLHGVCHVPEDVYTAVEYQDAYTITALAEDPLAPPDLPPPPVGQ